MLRAAGLCLVACAVAAAAHAAGPASAAPTTLDQALVQTYWTNPTLTGKRAELRAVDETAALARAAGRPQINGQMGTQNNYNGLTRFTDNGRQVTAGVKLAYPVFTGGRVQNAVRAADKRVLADRGDLRNTEGQVMVQAVGAYMDVIRDQAILDLNGGQVQLLEANLSANQRRLVVADVTKTDVAQSEARLALARSSLASAEGQLTASKEAFRQVIGAWPVGLQPPPPLPPLPGTPNDGVEMAMHDSPTLAIVSAQRDAAHFDTRSAKAERMPSVSLSTQHSYTNYLGTLEQTLGVPSGTLNNTVEATSVAVTMTVPLFQGGAASAKVRQAQAYESQALETTVLAERGIIANVRAAFAQYHATESQILASQAAVNSNVLALNGVKAENNVGSRTTLDVLNAEQELLNARVALVSAQHDHYAAGFALLNAMGQADAHALNLDIGPGYNVVDNYNRAQHTWSDWSDGPEPTVKATRTDSAATPGPTTAEAATASAVAQPAPR